MSAVVESFLSYDFFFVKFLKKKKKAFENVWR